MKKILLVGVLCFFSVQACTSPQPIDSGHDGMFDVLDELPQARVGVPRNSGLNHRDWSILREVAQNWEYPLSTLEITSKFGKRGRRRHQGVDFRAQVGTPVFSVGDGEVIYSSSQVRGYGRAVVIDHGNQIVTVYAHHSKNLVEVGEHVTKGQVIALTGRSGRTKGAHLHFEVRKDSVPVNPLDVLPENLRVALRK